jgi:hypothetical protein
MSGAALSVGLYATFKNRPGAYQGSPHHYHDAARPDAGFDLDRITIPSGPAANLSPANEHAIRGIAAGYGHALNEQLQAYYVLDRNYNYAFHNALFLRQTTVLADFRTIALDRINKARSTAAQTDAACDRLRDELRSDDPLRAFLDDLRGFVAFSFERAAQLAEMSASFEKTQAGLQHATHLYEGEGKIVGQWLASVLEKHERLLTDRRFHGMAGPVVEASRSIREMYANRIVGF